MAEIYDAGKEYWTVASRFRRNKGNMIMAGVATRDMDRMLEKTTNPAVRKRIVAFTTAHRPTSPGNPPFGSGPRFA